MDKLFKKCLIILLTLLISSCSTELKDYKHINDPFNIKSYFNGDIIAWGIVQDYSSKVQRRFCVEIKASWQGNNGLLAEKFYFSDGEISYRNWQLVLLSDGSYQGTAEDVVGTAIGKHRGFAFQFKYQLLLTLNDEIYKVNMDDWMYKIDQHRIINTTSMSKLGVDVAKITLFFDKEIPVTHCKMG